MKKIVLTFETINDVLTGKIEVDGRCIVPIAAALSPDLSEVERVICRELCYLSAQITSGDSNPRDQLITDGVHLLDEAVADYVGDLGTKCERFKRRVRAYIKRAKE